MPALVFMGIIVQLIFKNGVINPMYAVFNPKDEVLNPIYAVSKLKNGVINPMYAVYNLQRQGRAVAAA